LSAGFVFLCLVGGIFSFDLDHSEEEDRRVDWFGAFLVTAGLVLVVFVLAQGESAPQQWKTPCMSITTPSPRALVLTIF
jgi:hypothetical protein